MMIQGPIPKKDQLDNMFYCDKCPKSFKDKAYCRKHMTRLCPVYRDKGTPPKKGGGSNFTVTKLPSSLEPKGQRPLSLPHSP